MYVSTFQNIHGEDSVFVQHQNQEWPLFICGDDLTPEPIEMQEPPWTVDTKGLIVGPSGKSVPLLVTGVRSDSESHRILNDDEYAWLTQCWRASEHYREAYRKDREEWETEQGKK